LVGESESFIIELFLIGMGIVGRGVMILEEDDRLGIRDGGIGGRFFKFIIICSLPILYFCV
jgi:hypothetical protein